LLRRGSWNGRQLIPESWVAESLTPGALNPNYGLLWWLNTAGKHHRSAPQTSFYASGAGGNLTWIAPDRDLVGVLRWTDPSAVDTFAHLVRQGLA